MSDIPIMKRPPRSSDDLEFGSRSRAKYKPPRKATVKETQNKLVKTLRQLEQSFLGLGTDIKEFQKAHKDDKKLTTEYSNLQQKAIQKNLESFKELLQKQKEIILLSKTKGKSEKDIAYLRQLRTFEKTMLPIDKKFNPEGTEDFGGRSSRDRGGRDQSFEKTTNKFTEKFKEVLSKFTDHFSRFTDNMVQETKNFLLGPLQLVTKPLEDMGLELPSITGILGGTKKKKFNPTRSTVLQRIKDGEGFVLISDTIKKIFGDKETGKKGFFQNIFDKIKEGFLGTAMGQGIAGMAKKMFPTILKALPILAIAAGVLWGVFDAIAAVAKAQNWEVSKISAAIGGFIAGSGDGGIKDAFKNAGKWALIGAGIGSIVPVVGTLAGGLIGAAIGGILGYIGGKKVSQGIDAVSKWFSSIIDFKAIIDASPIGAFIRFFDSMKETWKDPSKSIGMKVGESIRYIGTLIWDIVLSPFKMILDLFTGKLFKKDAMKNISASMKDGIKSIGRFFSDMFEGLFKGVKPLDFIKDKFNDWVSEPINKMLLFVKVKFDEVTAWIKEKFNDWVLTPIKTAVSFIGEKFNEFVKSPFMQNIIETFKTVFGGIETYIITPIKKVIGGIWGFIKEIGNTFGFLFSGKFSLTDALLSLATGNKEKSFSGQLEGYKNEKKLLEAAASDKDVRSSIQSTREYQQALRDSRGNTEMALKTAIEDIVKAQQKSGNNTQINNIMSNYHPMNVMNNGMVGNF